MASTRTFHKTTIIVSVLSEEEFVYYDLGHLEVAIGAGSYCSGSVRIAAREEVSGITMAKELIKQERDPAFFQLDADGNDLDDQPIALA